jgi:ADP-ribose pyrophosphatase YjhB (NUDIX family)
VTNVATIWERVLHDRSAIRLKLHSLLNSLAPLSSSPLLFYNNRLVQQMLERVLFIRAIRNPAYGYVQGINDLLTPFMAVFLSEHLPGGVADWRAEDLPEDRRREVRQANNIRKDALSAPPGFSSPLSRPASHVVMLFFFGELITKQKHRWRPIASGV